MTLTTLHLGHVSGRARRASVRPGHSVAAAAWRTATPAFGGLRATTVAPASNADATGYEGIAVPAGDMGFCTTPMTKRPARHLGSRST